jgi:hypothetical protein
MYPPATTATVGRLPRRHCLRLELVSALICPLPATPFHVECSEVTSPYPAGRDRVSCPVKIEEPAWRVASKDDEFEEQPIDPLLGQQRMVADPGISAVQAATVLGETVQHIQRLRHWAGSPPTTRPTRSGSCGCPMCNVSATAASRSP